MIGAYLAGLATIPAIGVLAWLGLWLTERNLEKTCGRCGRIFGSLDTPRTYDRVTRARYRLHRWTGACKRRQREDA